MWEELASRTNAVRHQVRVKYSSRYALDPNSGICGCGRRTVSVRTVRSGRSRVPLCVQRQPAEPSQHSSEMQAVIRSASDRSERSRRKCCRGCEASCVALALMLASKSGVAQTPDFDLIFDLLASALDRSGNRLATLCPMAAVMGGKSKHAFSLISNVRSGPALRPRGRPVVSPSTATAR